MHSFDNWDDLRFVLAVAHAGSVSKAARELKVNHATVIRRVAQFEEMNGIEMFEKTVRGYRMTPGTQRILDAMQDVQNAVDGVGRAVSGLGEPVGGTVRVTSTDTFCVHVLPGILTGIHERASALHIELLTVNAHLDLSRLDADLAVRPAMSLPAELTGDSPAVLGMSCYRLRGKEETVWLGLNHTLSRAPAAQWMAQNVPQSEIVASADSFVVLARLVAAGLGQAFLPRVIGDANPQLERVETGAPDLNVPIWVAGHKDLVEVPRIRATCALLSEGLATRADALLAHDPPAR